MFNPQEQEDHREKILYHTEQVIRDKRLPVIPRIEELAMTEEDRLKEHRVTGEGGLLGFLFADLAWALDGPGSELERREWIRGFLGDHPDLLAFWPQIDPANLRQAARFFQYEVLDIAPWSPFLVMWLAGEVERDCDQFYP